MSELPRLGKLPPDVFEEVIYPNLGLVGSEVLVKPNHGVDVGVVSLGDIVLIVKSDPVFVVPEYGWERSAWFAVHILASDVSTSGVAPKYLAIDLNLPQSMKKEEFVKLWKGIHNECRKLGVAVVTGHTGKYEGIDYPMIGGATMFTVAQKDGYVTTEMAKPGDKVIMTKGPAIEAAGILSTMFPKYVEEKYGKEFALRARELFYLQSVVEDALILAKIGLRSGVTSMHDATEYGVWGALHDVARASKVGIKVMKEKLFMKEEVKKVINAFSELTGIEADPFAAISEGTLIATVKPQRTSEAILMLKEKGIDAEVIGEVTDECEEVVLIEEGKERNIERPKQDPFWPIFFKT
ncbi:MAG: AIR synthase family protein, partial [Thermoproteota archaeon]